MQLIDWTLMVNGECSTLSNSKIKAHVPGDITCDLWKSGIIENPYYGQNHKDIRWIFDQDFIYTSVFDVDAEMLQCDEVLLTFDAVDLFSEITLNGYCIGTTKNMFLQYVFNIKPYLQLSGNVLQVKMQSTTKVAQKYNCDGYMGIFNLPRIFLRKTQCHFGWDWAPNLPGYGICGEVRLEGVSQYRIDDITYRTRNDGKITFITELNYCIHPTVDEMGVPIPNTSVPFDNDELVYRVEKQPGSGVYIEKTISVTGRKNIFNISLDDPQLWWPVGYGTQPLYHYTVSLYRNGKCVCEKSGRFAIREVSLVQEPKSEQFVGFEFYINGVKIFAQGSNWVPIDCFTGSIEDKKYKDLLQLAANANMNMLRVWGGGLYEKDVFYNTCDELGIMVWQDFMNACSDLPENDLPWQENAIEECEYQIRRLRNHPCIVYWCGGNEKVGSFVRQRPKGDFFIDYILTGIVSRMDPTRPFGRQSPCSFTELGSDSVSGDCHSSSFDRPFFDWMQTGTNTVTQYRKFVSEKIYPFLSENASFGPHSVATNRKIYPVDKQWPLNEYWFDRMTCNPYDGMGGYPFAKKLDVLIEGMYGKAQSMEDYVAKGMVLHAECMRAELEWVRVHKAVTGGFMNWMYSDIWPCGTWSVVDYYTEPKQVYYQMKRSLRPVLATFFMDTDGTTKLSVDNGSNKPVKLNVTYGKRTYAGETVQSEKIQITLDCGEVCHKAVSFPVEDPNTYLFVTWDDGEKVESNVYSPDMWRSAEFSGSYTIETEQMEPCKAKITVKANGFVKGLYLSFPDNCNYRFSDNYLDVEDGQEVTVTVTAEHPIDLQQLMTTDYAKMAKESSYV